MSDVIQRYAIGILFLSTLLFGILAVPTLAHDGEDHVDAASAAMHEAETETQSIAEMQKLISLLNQLITLLNALHLKQSSTSVTPMVIDTQD